MNVLRTCAVTLGMLCAVLGAPLSAFTLFQSLFLESSSWSGSSWLEKEIARAEALSGELDTVKAGLTAKIEIAKALRAGRLSLTEAVAQFRAVDGHRVAELLEQFPSLPGDTDNQRYAAYVVSWTFGSVPEIPQESTASSRVLGELWEIFAESRAYQYGPPSQDAGSAHGADERCNAGGCGRANDGHDGSIPNLTARSGNRSPTDACQ